MQHTHTFSAALRRVVRNEGTVVLKKGCLDLYTVKAGCRLPVWGSSMNCTETGTFGNFIFRWYVDVRVFP